MKIPIIVCHGINDNLSIEHFTTLIAIASEMGFNTINYDQLYQTVTRGALLPDRPIMIDFDHPNLSIYTDIFPVLLQYGYIGNWFINTECLEAQTETETPDNSAYADWSQIRHLYQSGWTIGAHTHTHPNFSTLVAEDPTGKTIRDELEKNDYMIESALGFKPEYFAFTGAENGITWSETAEREVKRRYKMSRLWILDTYCEVDGKKIRYAELLDCQQADEEDGGPAYSLRYITKETPLYKLPAMELEGLIYQPDKFREYLFQALP